MKISELKKKYKNKWVLVDVDKETKNHKIKEATLLMASNEKQKVYDKLTKVKEGSHVAIMYTGRIYKKDLIFTL